MSKPVFKRQVEVPIYQCVVLFCLADTMEETKAYVERHHAPAKFEQKTDCDGRCSFDSQGRFGILFERGVEHRTVAHECFHLTACILRYHGVDFDAYNHEAYAYLCGWLSEWVYRMLKKAGETVK